MIGHDEQVQAKILLAKALNKYPPLPASIRKQSRSAVIGGSGVDIPLGERFSVDTPFGLVVNVSFLDEGQQVLFLNRHHCTHLDATTSEVRYAPPHEANYKAMVWCLHECGAQRVIALSSTGSLNPEHVPVGSVVMPDDFYMVKPEPITFWPHPALGTFDADASKGQVGRIHFAPAIKEDSAWVDLRTELQKMIQPVLATPAGKSVRLCQGQNQLTWPCFTDSGGLWE